MSSVQVGPGRSRESRDVRLIFLCYSFPVFNVRLCYADAIITVRSGYTASSANPSCFVWPAMALSRGPPHLGSRNHPPTMHGGRRGIDRGTLPH